MKKLWILSACLLLTLGFGCSSSKQAPTAEGEKWNDQYRANYEVPYGKYTGRSPYVKGGDAEVPAPRPVPAPAKVTNKGNCTEIETDLLHATIRMPTQVTLGEEFMYEITIITLDCVGNLLVTDQVPPGSTYIRSEPAATKDGDLLIWKFPEVDAAQTKTLKIWLRPDGEGTIRSCAILRADPRMCAETVVGKATLQLTKTGPTTAKLGENVTYNMVVRNTGNTVAKNVVITDPVPEGFTSPNGQSTLTFNVGDLPPGQSKTYSTTFKANKRGRICNTATAAASNATKVSSEACTTIVQPGLKVSKTGPAEQYMGRNADYTVVVKNTGDTELTQVVVTDTAPAETKFVTATGGTIKENVATFNVGTLRAGEEKSYKVSLTSQKAGRYCNRVNATAAGGLSEAAEACTVWKGYPALLIEVVDNPDPLQIGETTTFTIRVTNQGTADDTNVSIVAKFPKEMTPTSASGATPGRIEGNTVRFAPFGRLEPKKSLEFTVKGKAAALGDSRIKVELNSDLLKSPVTEEESTQVY